MLTLDFLQTGLDSVSAGTESALTTYMSFWTIDGDLIRVFLFMSASVPKCRLFSLNTCHGNFVLVSRVQNIHLESDIHTNIARTCSELQPPLAKGVALFLIWT